MMREDDELAGLILLYQNTQDVMMPCYLQYLIDPESVNQLILQKKRENISKCLVTSLNTTGKCNHRFKTVEQSQRQEKK